MCDTIRLVSTPLMLVAFIVACITAIIRHQLRQRVEMIKAQYFTILAGSGRGTDRGEQYGRGSGL